jgi:2-polyprenyl-3-methyl-5-hydroxy-6-metoxy-1,4-benzoquinol methylase
VVEAHKQAEVASRTPDFLAHEATKPFGWDAAHFVEWATVTAIIHELGLQPGARAIDAGCGSGWTSLFLAEAGIHVTGYDIVPGNVELAAARARRWGLEDRASFAVADIEALGSGEPAELVLIFDALHHSTRPAQVLRSVATRLAPGGWLVLGEPTWLHRISPEARRVSRERGWHEGGFTVRGLRRDLRAAGLTDVRRFQQPTRPVAHRPGLVAYQLARLAGAALLAAPQMHIWLAARRPA